MWIELLLLLYAVIVIWLTKQVHSVPDPVPIQDHELLSCVQDRIDELDASLHQLGFRFAANMDCSDSSELTAHVRFYLNPTRDIEFAAMAVQYMGQPGSLTLEYSSMLTPHAELCTNNSSDFEAIAISANKFIMKMSWVKDLSQLLQHHQEHLSTLSQFGFHTVVLTESGFAKRIAQQSLESLEFQVQKRRLRRIEPNAYRMTLWGAFLGTPLIALAMAYPFLNRLVGRRSAASRKRKLARQAKCARRQTRKRSLIAGSGAHTIAP